MKLFRPTISFFCPAYNDEDNLPILIPKAIKVFKKIASKFEIVIIEDGSPDRTALIADSLAKKYKFYVRVIHHKKNQGYGAALKKGFKVANKYEYVCYTDGDLQFDVSEYARLVPYLKKYKAVVGYRRKRSLSKQRLLQTRIYNFMVRVLFQTKVRDVNCSMKIIKRSVMDGIHLTSVSPFLDAELLISLQRGGIEIEQVPVSHYDRLYGKASGGKPSIIFDTIKEMFTFLIKSH